MGRGGSRNVKCSLSNGGLKDRPTSSHRLSEAVRMCSEGENQGGRPERDEGMTKYPPEQVLEGRDGGRLAAVVLVAVDVQHPFAADGEHAREDALLQAGAEDDRVVLLIHVRAGREAGRWRRNCAGLAVLSRDFSTSGCACVYR